MASRRLLRRMFRFRVAVMMGRWGFRNQWKWEEEEEEALLLPRPQRRPGYGMDLGGGKTRGTLMAVGKTD